MSQPDALEALAMRPLLTRSDLAVRYRVTLRAVDKWHSSGKLPPAVYLPGSFIPLWRPADIKRNEIRWSKNFRRKYLKK